MSFANLELLSHGHVNGHNAVRVGDVGAGVAERELRRQNKRRLIEPLIRCLWTGVGIAYQVGTLRRTARVGSIDTGRNQ